MIEIPLSRWLFPGEIPMRRMLWTWAKDVVPVKLVQTDYGWKAFARIG